MKFLAKYNSYTVETTVGPVTFTQGEYNTVDNKEIAAIKQTPAFQNGEITGVTEKEMRADAGK